MRLRFSCHRTLARRASNNCSPTFESDAKIRHPGGEIKYSGGNGLARREVPSWRTRIALECSQLLASAAEGGAERVLHCCNVALLQCCNVALLHYYLPKCLRKSMGVKDCQNTAP